MNCLRGLSCQREVFEKMGVSRKETSTQRKRRLEKKRTTRKLKLANESEEEKRQRLQKQRDRAHKARLEKLARQDDVPSQVCFKSKFVLPDSAAKSLNFEPIQLSEFFRHPVYFSVARTAKTDVCFNL